MRTLFDGDEANAPAIGQRSLVGWIDSGEDQGVGVTLPIEDVTGDDVPEHIRRSLSVAESLALPVLLDCREDEKSLVRIRSASVASCRDQFLAVQDEKQAVVRADAVDRSHVRDSLRPKVSLHESLVIPAQLASGIVRAGTVMMFPSARRRST